MGCHGQDWVEPTLRPDKSGQMSFVATEQVLGVGTAQMLAAATEPTAELELKLN